MASKKKRSKKTPQQVFRLVPDKKNATTTAVSSIDELKGLWDRQWGVYLPLVVKVTKRVGSVLTFRIVLAPNGTPGTTEYDVDLDEGRNVWSDLPSTAQFAKPGGDDIGYLLVNQNWLFENGAAVDLKRVFGGKGGAAGPKLPQWFSL
jgi:hypothetical protein